MNHPSSSSATRIVSLVVLLIGVVILAPLVSYLSVVFGWTNPTENPPGGSGILTAYNGKLGINAPTPSSSLTVAGTISAVTVTDLIAPVAASDAANKFYVDAQVGGGGSLVLYGIGTSNIAGAYNTPGGALPANCYRSYPSGAIICNSVPTAATVAAGSGAPACPTDWTEAYAGYGPHGTLWAFYGGTGAQQNSLDASENSMPGSAAAATYSVCSTSAYEVIEDNYTNAQAGVITSQGTYLSACRATLQNGNKVGDVCNTCRVCVK